MHKKRFKGFTLVELVVVISIIAVLASILVPSMMGYVKKSKYAKANSNAKSIYNQLAGSAVDLDLSGNTMFDFTLTVTDMNNWINGLQLSDSQKQYLCGSMGGYIALSYKGGYPEIVAWGDNNSSDAVIGRYPNPTSSDQYVTWNNVLSDWNNK